MGIPDATPDDAYDAGDSDVDWDQVDVVAQQIDLIEAIEDPDERLAAAKAWAADLAR